VMGSLLYDVSGAGPVMIALAAAILSMCALVAALVPARPATRIDPMVALRYE
jgi:putative ABC transport system permease protein